MKPGDIIWHPWNVSSLVQVMACCLFSARPLPKPMLTYHQLDTWEQTSQKLESKYEIFHSTQCNWNVLCKMWVILLKSLYPHLHKATITHWRFLSALSGGSKTVNERSWAPQSADTTVGECHQAPLGANSGGGRTEVLKCSKLPPLSASEISVRHGVQSSVVNCTRL